MRTPSDPSPARPLSGAARLALTISTAATILLFYLFITLSILGLLLWLGMLLLVALAGARFGLAGFIARFAERDIQVFTLLGRSLWLTAGAAYRLPLRPEDAPRLFAMLEKLAARFAMPPPDELCLEMSCGAWVEMRGLKLGLGTTRVGIGYDLLAGLTEQEVEAVMAHELAHAKLIGRFFHNRLARGFSRAVTVSRRLSDLADTYRRADKSLGIGGWILALSDALTRLCARQMGAYSRQGEFEADQGAAQLCGSAPLRSALLRLDQLHPVLERLPWSERLAQIESPDGLSGWLRRELAVARSADDASPPEVFDRYSTHPPRRDRLAALPDDGSRLESSQPGLTLLVAPDAVALKLVEAIQQTALLQEKLDQRELKKWRRSLHRSTHIRLAQVPGSLLLLIGFVFGLIALFSGFWQVGLLLLLVAVPAGVGLYRLGGYRDRRTLPVPDYETFMKVRQSFPLPDLEPRQKQIEEELRAQLTPKPKRREKLGFLLDEAYAALGQADYLRAHVAARLANDHGSKSEERQLAMMVAAAAFEQNDVVEGLFQNLLNQTGFATPTTSFGAGWMFLIGGNWMHAEAFFLVALKHRPDDRNLGAMLALCQSRRGKLQSAIENIRRCCQPSAPSAEHLKLFADLLLDRGALREAAEQLAQLAPAMAYDPESVLLRVRLHLLRREFGEAERQLTMLAESDFTGARLLALGYLYENARADVQAVAYFQRALARGHYPEALLALARHAHATKDKERARGHILGALDTTKSLGERAASIYALFPRALAQLVELEEPVVSCRAWITGFLPGRDLGPLGKHSLVVFAHTEQEVQDHFARLLAAMRPDEPPVTGAYLNISLAPRDLQPLRPVRPGIQYVYR
jgi:Zn-dependent protease with chaperone function/tetratricopeptide (TPR) repeat protein